MAYKILTYTSTKFMEGMITDMTFDEMTVGCKYNIFGKDYTLHQMGRVLGFSNENDVLVLEQID